MKDNRIIKPYQIEKLITMDPKKVYELIIKDTLKLIFLFEIKGYSISALYYDVLNISDEESSLIKILDITDWLNDNPPVQNFLTFIKDDNLDKPRESGSRREQLFKTYWALHKLTERKSFLFKQ